MSLRRPERCDWPATWLVCLLAAACSDEPAPSAELEPSADPRLAYLYAPCASDGFFQADTTDPLALLEIGLEEGQLDTLRRAREELAREGEAGLAVARRVFDRHFEDPFGEPHLRNAMDVAALSTADGARELVLRGLEHAHESVRLAALRTLRKRPTGSRVPDLGRAEDFDRVLALIPESGPDSLETVLTLLADLDPARAEDQYAEWMLRGQYPPLWSRFALTLARSRRPEVVAFARAHREELPEPVRSLLGVALVSDGDPDAAAEIESKLAAGDPAMTGPLAQGVVSAWASEALVLGIARSPAVALRKLALGALASHATPEALRALREGTRDPDEEVRFLSQAALVERGDAAAIDQSLADLDSLHLLELDFALRALRLRFAAQPELCERAAERLLAREGSESARPVGERLRLLQGLGQIPSPRTAQRLLELARTVQEPLQGDRAHRWLCLQIGNTRAAGKAILLAALEGEHDPLHRLDLLEALCTLGELVREELCAWLQRPDLPPQETVYLCDALARLGPTRSMAPLLERVGLAVSDPPARRAVHCILWRAYPARRAR